MKIQCTECGYSADVDPQRLPATVKSVLCPKCKCRFLLAPQSQPKKTIVCPRCNLRQAPAAACRKCQRSFTNRPPASARPAQVRRSPKSPLASTSRKGIFLSVLLIGVLLLAVGGFYFFSNGPVSVVVASAPATGQPDAPPPIEITSPQTVDLIRSVASGSRHTAVVRSDGTLWMWGDNFYAQLGNGKRDKGTKEPMPLDSTGGFSAVAVGHGHTVGLKQNGTVWAWGVNREGQAGCNSEQTTILRPTQAVGLKSITAVAAAGNHSLALKDDGTVWAWGENLSGQVGSYGAERMIRKPQQVPRLINVTAIAAGRSHSMALDSQGDVYVWGGIFPKIPGNNENLRRHAPVRVSGLPTIVAIAAGDLDSVALDSDGTAWKLSGKYTFSPQEKSTMNVDEMRAAALNITPSKIEGLDTVAGIAAGGNHFLAVKTDGTVWGWGSNHRGELAAFNIKISEAPRQIIRYRQSTGTVTNAQDTLPLEDIVLVAAGEYGSFALDSNGLLWTWGDNSYGQRGIPEGFKPRFPWPVSSQTGIMDHNNVTMKPQEQIVAVSTHVLATSRPTYKLFAGGYQHSLYIDNNLDLWAWGENEDGQLGGRFFRDNVKAPKQVKIKNAGSFVEVVASHYYTAALEESGSVWVWGKNPYKSREDRFPRKVADNMRRIFAGRNMFLGIDQHGDVFTWGGKLNGSVRNSADKTRDDVPEKIPSLHNIVDVAAGYGHVLALDTEGHVYAWGDNRYGQLGTDSKISRQKQVPIEGLNDIVQVAAGRTISLALKKDGTVLAWGQGLATDFNGKNLLSSLKPVPMVGLDDVVAIACGGLISESGGHNLALKADGTVWAWGHNSFGQLGDGTFKNTRTTPTRVLELSNAVAIAAGDMHSLALRADGHLVGWGNNMRNQVGASTGGMVTMPMAVVGL